MTQAARTTRISLPAFVVVAAVCAALANLVPVTLWVGGLQVLAGDGAPLRDAIPSTVLALVSAVVTASIVLRSFDLQARDSGRCYRIVVASFCLGGTIMGGLLGWLWVLDGTLGPGTFADILAQGTTAVLATLAYALVPGLVGAVFGIVVGLVEGLVFAFPLAAMLDRYGDAR